MPKPSKSELLTQLQIANDRVYKPDGTRRFQRLQGRQIIAATSVGPYVCADTTANRRYSVDLRSGKATGPLPASARIVIPSYVVIP